MRLLKKIASIFSKPTKSKSTRVPAKANAKTDQFLQELAQKSPRSKCGVCGKEIRGASGGIVTFSGGGDLLEKYFSQRRLVCPSCGFIACWDCSANMEIQKNICAQCGDKMEFS